MQISRFAHPPRWAALGFCAWLLLFWGFPLQAQSVNALFLEEELAALENTLLDSRIAGPDRYRALINLALLQQLSGNIEAAAETYTLAAVRGDSYDWPSLLAAARCFIALGELDRADLAIKTLLLNGQNSPLYLEGMFLGHLSEAIRTGNESILTSLLLRNEYADRQPMLLYTLSVLTGNSAYQARLAMDYPQSIEARIAADTAGSIGVAPSALWLLLPAQCNPNPRPPAFAMGSSPLTTGQIAPSPSVPAMALQAGLFNLEENAVALVERLTRAGFSPYIIRRRLNTAYYYGVNIPGGADMNQTIRELKNLGIESFPVDAP